MKRRCRRRREGLVALIFLLPSLVGLLMFFLLPFIDTVRRSFFDATENINLGIENYRSVVHNQAFQLAAKNTAMFIGICIPLLLGLSLVLALLIRAVRPHGVYFKRQPRGLLNYQRVLPAAKRRERDFDKVYFKTAYLLPMAIPVASMVLLWNVLFHENGLVNAVMVKCGLTAVDFMDTSAAFWILILTYLWKNCGYDMVLWLAGLDGISPSLYEAAHVDGAGGWQCFWRITLPSLLPTLGIVTVLSILNSFKVFREAYLVAGAYPHDSLYLLQHLFNNWFQTLDLGRLCAAAVMLCIGLLVLIVPVQHFLNSTDD